MTSDDGPDAVPHSQRFETRRVTVPALEAHCNLAPVSGSLGRVFELCQVSTQHIGDGRQVSIGISRAIAANNFPRIAIQLLYGAPSPPLTYLMKHAAMQFPTVRSAQS